jgi:hypothetical protein
MENLHELCMLIVCMLGVEGRANLEFLNEYCEFLRNLIIIRWIITSGYF